MFSSNFTINRLCKQRQAFACPGFLCIELLQGLLLLSVLLLLMSAFHVLSVYTQEQTVQRLQALDYIASELVGAHNMPQDNAMRVTYKEHECHVIEFAHIMQKPVYVVQKEVKAMWHDSRGKLHSIRVVS
ncbi:MAG: hypothetical protein AB7F19_07310 [Candidatus Babeliales bacterium]